MRGRVVYRSNRYTNAEMMLFVVHIIAFIDKDWKQSIVDAHYYNEKQHVVNI
jgi:hypothetical protein